MKTNQPAAARPNEKFQTGNVITIALAHLVHDVYTSFLAPVLPLLIAKFGLSYSMSGFLSVAQRLPSLANPFLGLMADRISMRYLVIVAPTVSAVAMSLMGVAPSYFVLVVLMLVMGIGASLFHVPTPVMMKKVAGPKAGLAMSLYMLGGESARTLGPLTITGAITIWGFQGTWKLIPFAVMASIILYYKLASIQIHHDFKGKKREHGAFKTFTKFLPFFIVVTLFMLCASMVKSSINYFLPTMLTKNGGSLWEANVNLAIFQFAGMGGTLAAGFVADKIGHKTTLFISAIMSPILMLLFVQFIGTVWAVPLLLSIGVVIFMNTPVLLTMVTELKTDRPAFLNGIFMTIILAVGSVAVMLIGLVADHLDLKETFRIAAYIGFGSVPLLFLINPHKQ